MQNMPQIQFSLNVAANGRVVIPTALRRQLGCQDGGRLLARLVDGTVILEPVDLAIRRAQALVAKFLPQNSGLAEELIAERREAAKHE